MTNRNENWPFIMFPYGDDDHNNVALDADKYYAFGDAGGILGPWNTLEDGREHLVKKEFADVDIKSIDKYITTTPEELGGSVYTLITGRQFVDRLYEISDTLEDYGKWSK